jgi:hypothetical protein
MHDDDFTFTLPYHWNPDIDQETTQYKHKVSSTLRKFHVHKHTGNITVSMFVDYEGLLLLQFIRHNFVLNGESYATIMKAFMTH